MSNYTFEDKTQALVGIYQAAQCVFELATTGKTDQTAYQHSINSLFVQNPSNTLDVFGGQVAHIQKGVETLLAQMQAQDTSYNNNNQTRNIEITKYVLSLIILEKKLQQQPEVLDKVFRVLESAEHNRDHFGEFHENIIATLARAYGDNVSKVNPRIMVKGQQGHLQNARTANKIRALLLAGLRSAMLWRQVGGSRWGLLWSRKKYLQAAQSLYRPDSHRPSHFSEESHHD